MFLIIGKIHEIVPSQFTNKETGEVSDQFSVEVLHKELGKSVITSLKLDVSVVPEWTKHLGKDFNAQIRPWAMKSRDGINSGFALADKKSLPNLMRSGQAAPAAPAA